jgi:hypothetical protein
VLSLSGFYAGIAPRQIYVNGTVYWEGFVGALMAWMGAQQAPSALEPVSGAWLVFVPVPRSPLKRKQSILGSSLGPFKQGDTYSRRATS